MKPCWKARVWIVKVSTNGKGGHNKHKGIMQLNWTHGFLATRFFISLLLYKMSKIRSLNQNDRSGWEVSGRIMVKE